MIVFDGSALFAILLDEAEAGACERVFANEGSFALSAVSLAGILIVASRKRMLPRAEYFLAELAPTVVPLTEARAHGAASAYARWGKGVHPARLNIIDCFAYALSKELGCPLLFVGNDFAQTDVVPTLA